MVQNYPRISDERSRYHSFLDDSKLASHRHKLTKDRVRELISQAITNANAKSSRAILNISSNATSEEISSIYKEKGKELFTYFKGYYGDPAATAHQIVGRSYIAVGTEQFRTQSLQKERMNSGWRYQFLATECAKSTGRFDSVSDIGSAEADFNAQIRVVDSDAVVNLYVSIKNRENTLGGQDWPKAIQALETIAKTDKNRNGPYCCVFGIAIESKARVDRRIPKRKKDNQPHSSNTEVWFSNFFWPFFTNFDYREIMLEVLEVLMEMEAASELSTFVEAPPELLESFGDACRDAGLIDEKGFFHDSVKLVEFFCS
ncbi:MAG: hypothetical protein HYU84_01490 [Chloroflexi bacterium]|nr:hypothetical protein [Chloroflexota bacterium]MBI3159674.1 hypothetical protein [Chloroflexota bacterium]